MSKKLREKIKRCGAGAGRKRRVRIRYLAAAIAMVGVMGAPHYNTMAGSCPDVRVVFVRGSGEERWEDQNYLTWRDAMAEKLATTRLNYEFIDLDYPAVGISDLGVLAGAYFGAGEAYEFGESVREGVKKLDKMVNGTGCPDTRYVLGGYSQGAMVVSGALAGLNADRLIYAATFGDPKLYLPEGEGVMPVACKGEGLSDYRMYVPDCRAYKGMLGAYIPYEPDALAGKVGTWCNKRDIMCSSKHWDFLAGISDHTAYVADNLYEDASRVIFDKICQAFGVENTVSSPHDTAFLLDSTGSMASMLELYKTEALRLAQETLNSGGRVALYDYRDLDDPYTPVKHCDFDTCTLEIFEAELAGIRADGGGDTPESLLSASFKVMDELEWRWGATKSLVVLTDANYLSPDRDGMTLDEVVRLSKQIDPVNFYVITEPDYAEDYADLARMTGGKVVTDFDELSLLTDYIMRRYDTLPKVEEDFSTVTPPVLEVAETVTRGDEVQVKFTTDGTRVLVVLDDAMLGMAEVHDGAGSVTITGLDWTAENTIRLVPLGDDVRGEAVEVRLNDGYGAVRAETDSVAEFGLTTEATKIKAPNTGQQ